MNNGGKAKQSKNNKPKIQELRMSIFHIESIASRLTTAKFYVKRIKSNWEITQVFYVTCELETFDISYSCLRRATQAWQLPLIYTPICYTTTLEV